MHEQRTARKRSTPWQNRFWRYITPTQGDGCWEWQGSRDQHGYGRLQRGRRGEGHIKAHRASYEIHKGPIPDGQLVLHGCDNPPCCNPAHLSVGDFVANGQDMESKGRTGRVFGAANGKTVLSDETVRAIRTAVADGASYPDVAAAHGLTAKYVCALALGRRRAAAGGPIREVKAA